MQDLKFYAQYDETSQEYTKNDGLIVTLNRTSDGLFFKLTTTVSYSSFDIESINNINSYGRWLDYGSNSVINKNKGTFS